MSFVLLVVGTFFGMVSATIAHYKGRSRLRWFLVGFFLHVLGLVVVFLPMAIKPGVTKQCLNCAEIVKAEARRCRYCGAVLGAAEPRELVGRMEVGQT